jgi:hypothetical protein
MIILDGLGSYLRLLLSTKLQIQKGKAPEFRPGPFTVYFYFSESKVINRHFIFRLE